MFTPKYPPAVDARYQPSTAGFQVEPYRGPIEHPVVVPAALPPASVVIDGRLYVAAHPMSPQMAPAASPVRWPRNPWVLIPAAVVAVCTIATVVIIVAFSLFTIVTIALAHALAIGVTLVALVIVSLVWMNHVAQMRHGYHSTRRY